jgi:hypothetical protein
MPNVDEENPVPVESVREDAAEEDAERAAARGDEAEDAHRLRSLGRLGEERHHEGKGNRRHDRAADALDGARPDQNPLRARKSAHGRGGGEQSNPGHEQPPVPEEVA